MNRFELICKINEASLSGNYQEVSDVLNEMFSDGSYKENLDLVYEAISAFQLYGFLAYLSQEEKNIFLNTDIWRAGAYRGIQLEYLNRGQLSVVEELDINKKIMLSAPTSFGKTTLIMEYILKNFRKINTIIFILPTNSLTEELYLKFLKNNKEYGLNYEITNQPSKIENRKVFLLTPERFLMMYQMENELLDKIDLIVMDEMYKIRKEENYSSHDFLNNRSMRFRKVADLIGNSENKVVYLSPFTYKDTDSMKAFLEKFSIRKLNRTTEYVKKEIKDVTNTLKSSKKPKRVVELLHKLENDKNIIYVNARDEAYKIIKEYERKNDLVQSERVKCFYEHIKKNYVIDEYEWEVAEALRKGVGIYISPMPRYIKKEIVNLYGQNDLSTIIATTAFTEGVNCNAKNLILTSKYTGKSIGLTQIDMLNVIGRVGRFANESVGNVYCIDSNTYNKVVEFTSEDDCLLENENYVVSEENRSDYEIDMMDLRYLKDEEMHRKEQISLEQQELELSDSDLNISLSVSKKWKITLYKFFKNNLNQNEIRKRKRMMNDILDYYDEGHFVEALSFFFIDIKNAFENNGISVKEAFPLQRGSTPAFNSNGGFIWGRMYSNYVLGDVKGSIQKSIRYIMARFNKEKGDNNFKTKKEAKELFVEKRCDWILDYFESDLSPKYNKYYTEYFNFVSNIIQYKIPFYLTFYLTIFNLYLRKEWTSEYNEEDTKEKDIMLLFEEGLLTKDYKDLSDFGIPIITLNKLKKLGISKDELKEKYNTMRELDSYERIMLSEFYGYNI